ncbi:MAG: hypothetical protein OXG56_00430 [Gammaproteobacteria bacterium]|nr:hypothetical protein [Gammaproteobacteria bacterium]
MRTLILLILITVCYAGYNLLIKVSGSHTGSVNTAPILATMALQASAFGVSVAYLIYLTQQNASVTLPGKAFIWAVGAGVCIGLAEILYFYLFRGFAEDKPVAGSVAIPFVVGGTIVISVLVSVLAFGEPLKPVQWLGVVLAFSGMILLAFSPG